jgi:hypothetical protein
MSERENAEYEERVSPYLLRPARTYEEYLRDRETSAQMLERFETRENRPGRASDNRVSNDALLVTGQGNRRDSADNKA